MTDSPDLRDLLPEDVPGEERDRLQRVHEMLVAAGPPPELPPILAAPRRPPLDLGFLRRRRLAALAFAACLVAASFLGGILVGEERADFDPQFSLAVRGTGQARQAVGSLEVGERDESGNRPMILRVRGLEPLGPRGYYEVLLTEKGKRPQSCGSFVVRGERTTTFLNAPYEITRASEWVVAAHRGGHVENPPVVMTT